MDNNDVNLKWCLPKCTNETKYIDNFLVYYNFYLIILFLQKIVILLDPQPYFQCVEVLDAY